MNIVENQNQRYNLEIGQIPEYPLEYLKLVSEYSDYLLVDPIFMECIGCRTSAEEIDNYTEQIIINEFFNGMCKFCENDFDHPFIWF